MFCKERQRLFDEYYDQVSAYFAAVSPSNAWSARDSKQARAASIAVEHARLVLEDHEQKHGCGNLFVQQTMSAPQRTLRSLDSKNGNVTKDGFCHVLPGMPHPYCPERERQVAQYEIAVREFRISLRD